MSAGNGDAVFQASELGQHFSSRNHRNLPSLRFLNFWIVGTHRRRGNDDMSVSNVFAHVARKDGCPTLFKALGDSRQAHIRTGHFVSEVEQDLSDAAHADAADPDKM